MEVFERYRPPFDLQADMLFMAALAPAGPLGRHFPEVPFLRIGTAVPMIVWFSRVTMLEYDFDGSRLVLDDEDGFAYEELNVVAVCRRRQLFIPGIYATSELSVAIGRGYGMPKEFIDMQFSASAGLRRVRSHARLGRSESWAKARLLTTGSSLARMIMSVGAWWTWPARFPSGRAIRARISAIPRVRLSWGEGVVDVGEPWLPEPLKLWRPGLYVPALRMSLPPPGYRRQRGGPERWVGTGHADHHQGRAGRGQAA